MKKFLGLFLISFLLFSGPASANVGEAAAWTGESAVGVAKDFGSATLNLVQCLGGTLWLAGEVIIFPFRLFER